MFKKKTCKKCGEKVGKKDSFCPNCGNYLSPYKKPSEKDEDWGMIGKEDEIESELNSNNLFGGFGGKIFNKMLNQTMKMLEKEIEKNMKESGKNLQNQNPFGNMGQGHFELYINGKKIPAENIKITKKPIQKVVRKKPQDKSKFFSLENTKKFSELPKNEPSTNLRRVENKIIYEISVPGVKSIEDVSIIKLENSIEIKAISKDKAYSKRIPVNLEISNYNLSDGKIVLELEE